MPTCSTRSWIREFDMTDAGFETSEVDIGPTGPGLKSFVGRGRTQLALSAILPGLPQLFSGRWGVGGMGLIVWVGLVGVLLTRWARFAAERSVS